MEESIIIENFEQLQEFIAKLPDLIEVDIPFPDLENANFDTCNIDFPNGDVIHVTYIGE